jgi:DNA-binding Xre family transcriptional regulator
MTIEKQEELRKKFAARLSKLMQDKGVNQQKLADAVGLSQQTINDYLNSYGKGAAPKLENIIALAKYFGVFCDYLMGVSDAPSPDVDFQDFARVCGLNETSLKTLERLASPDGMVGAIPKIKAEIDKENPRRLILKYEEPTTPDELAKRDALNIRGKKRAKNAIKALNDILSWRDAGELLSRLSEFLSYDERSIDNIDEHIPIKLMQGERIIDCELEPNRIGEVIFSGVQEALYRLRYDLRHDSSRDFLKKINKCNSDLIDSLIKYIEKTPPELKKPENQPPKKKGIKNGMN